MGKRKGVKLYDAGAAFLFVLLIVGIFVLMQEGKIPYKSVKSRSEVAMVMLESLSEDIAELRARDFKNQNAWGGHREALLAKVEAVYTQIQAGAYQGAMNKLQNDVEDKIRKWVIPDQQPKLLEKVDAIVALF